MSTQPPEDHYRQTLTKTQAGLEALIRREEQLGTLRLIVFALALLLALVFWKTTGMLFGLVPAAIFVVAVRLHRKTKLHRDFAERRRTLCQNGLDRLNNAWQVLGDDGLRFREATCHFANDLDLFGDGSLFAYLNTCPTEAGARVLAHWLQHPASAKSIEARQEAVQVLVKNPAFREALALGATSDQEHGLSGLTPVGEVSVLVALEDILASDLHEQTARWSQIANLGAALFLLNAATTLLGILPMSFLLCQAVLHLVLLEWYGKTFAKALEPLSHGRAQLHGFARRLGICENETFDSAHLADLQAGLTCGQIKASHSLHNLVSLTDRYIHFTWNGMGKMLSIPLLTPLRIASDIEHWKEAHRKELKDWLQRLGQFEALLALATYAFENPTHTFPVLVAEGPHFKATDLGHPLLPQSSCVCNDLHFDGTTKIFIISGSNMSGKSTLLRAVGTSTILALAGAPVRASGMELSRLILGTSISTEDSLSDGRSRFYAEMERLKTIDDLFNDTEPVLFLLDEFMHGTNSRDRCIGTAAILRRFARHHGIGLLTTHDLAISEIADDLDGVATNVHFEFDMVDDQMVFDYKMHPGVVQKSNAIQIMQALGLPVEAPGANVDGTAS